MIHRLAVFCGSKSGANPLYVEHAKKIGSWMAINQVTLIYGGGSVGIMGAIADTIMQNGGKVVGVIPEVLMQWEKGHTYITELIQVSDMHQRKKLMYDLCEAAVILPGGNGTMDELFEMLTWNTLQIHDKKIFLLNSGGYYHHLLEHFAHMQFEGFLHESWKDRLVVVDTPEQLFDLLIS